MTTILWIIGGLMAIPPWGILSDGWTGLSIQLSGFVILMITLLIQMDKR